MGAWIEIYDQSNNIYYDGGRTPRWVRGLKYKEYHQNQLLHLVAPHDGCVDWNNTFLGSSYPLMMSHPTMGAWIEIGSTYNK